MKKRIAIVLVLCIMLVFLLTMLTGCPESNNDSNNENDSKILLTLDNYEQYISLKCTFGGDPSTMHWNSLNSEYRYNAVKSTVKVSPVASYLRFENCIITVKIVGTYYYTATSSTTYSHEHKITLSIGGTAESSDIEQMSNAHDIRGRGYEVVSVSGYVIVE